MLTTVICSERKVEQLRIDADEGLYVHCTVRLNVLLSVTYLSSVLNVNFAIAAFVPIMRYHV